MAVRNANKGLSTPTKMVGVAVGLAVLLGVVVFVAKPASQPATTADGNGDTTLTETTSDGGAARTPHVLLVIADDLGWNDIGYSSSDLGSFTPNMNALSEDGVRMFRSYAGAVCTPSRAMLFTGKHSVQLGVQHWQVMPRQPWGMKTSEVTLPQYLSDYGYTSHLVGKWHLGHYNEASLPTNRGFDSFYGFLSGGENYVSHLSDDSCVTEEDGETIKCALDYFDNEDVATGVDGVYSTSALTERMQSIIQDHDADTPLLLVASYPNPHVPLMSDNQMDKEFADELDEIPSSNRRTYASMVASMDQSLGTIVNELKDKGMYEDTLIIFTSDNGGSVEGAGNNYPLRGEKHYYYEGGVRVHSFVAGGVVPDSARGTEYNGLFHISDWVPTILQGAMGVDEEDLAHTDSWYGTNQWDALTSGGTEDSPRSEVLLNIDYLDSDGDFLGYSRAAFIKDGIKMLINERKVDWFDVPTTNDLQTANAGAEVTAVYNVFEDPTESDNLHETMTADEVSELRQFYQQNYVAMMEPCIWKPDDDDADDAWAEAGGVLTPWIDESVSDSVLAQDVLATRPDRWAFESKLPTIQARTASPISTKRAEVIAQKAKKQQAQKNASQAKRKAA